MKLDWRTKYIIIRIFPQLVQLLMAVMLLGNSSASQYIKTKNNHREADILRPVVETLPENKECSERFNQSRYTIPHPVDPKDVGLFETSDEEVDVPIS